MTRRLIIVAALWLLTTGCNRQDADTLARIGDSLATRAKAVAPGKQGKDKMTAAVPGLGGGNVGSQKTKPKAGP